VAESPKAASTSNSSGETKRSAVRSKWLIAQIALLVIGIGLAATGGYALYKKPSRAYFGANLSSFDSIQLAYKSAQVEQISPMCGCFNEQKSDAWRGVAFASRRITVERQGTKPFTAYFIGSPAPDSIDWAPATFLLDATVFERPLSNVVEYFEPHQTLSSLSGFSLYEKLKPELYVLIITDKPLHIAPLGDAPFGAWIPVAAARLTISPRFDALSVIRKHCRS